MLCLTCGSEMSRGAPHADGDEFQWECSHCGRIIRPYEAEREFERQVYEFGQRHPDKNY